MAVVIKVLKTLRNHWKKSTFAGIVLAYGGNYYYNKYQMLQLMRAYCEEAKQYGSQTIPVFSKPRHVTVILNPAAHDGKGKKFYELYSAPLLHLAGLKVSVVQTEHEGQARDLMEIMDNTDAVIIAGGNGTLHEAVTGLLRRKDEETASERFPMGIVPLGKTNSVAKRLFWKPESTQAQWLAEATMAVIRETRRQLDVMEIKGEKGRPVYSVSHLDYGVIRDTSTNVGKYWYLGPLKAIAAFTFRSMKAWPVEREIEESYTLPCGGCSKCYKAIEKQKSGENATGSPRWWHAFIPRTSHGRTDSTSKVDYSQIQNNECGVWHNNIMNCSNLTVYSDNIVSSEQAIEEEKNPSSLHVKIHPTAIGRSDFIREGLAHYNEGVAAPSAIAENHSAREIKLSFNVPEGEELWCSIDSENYEVQLMSILLQPKKIHIYA